MSLCRACARLQVSPEYCVHLIPKLVKVNPSIHPSLVYLKSTLRDIFSHAPESNPDRRPTIAARCYVNIPAPAIPPTKRGDVTQVYTQLNGRGCCANKTARYHTVLFPTLPTLPLFLLIMAFVYKTALEPQQLQMHCIMVCFVFP